MQDLLKSLPTLFQKTMETQSALGSALQAAFKLLSPTGGRMSVFQTQLPNLGVGALQSREDPNQRASAKVSSPVGCCFLSLQLGVSTFFLFQLHYRINFDAQPLIFDCCCSSGHPALISRNGLLQKACFGLLWTAGGCRPVPAECSVL